jgi:uncharacterized protein YqjF (DUF2071 family)
VPRAFLTAEWRNLLMINFAVDPSILAPFVPNGTELDSWQGITFVSLVGFLFADTRLLGVPVPRHRTFEEVNLRFYVRRTVGDEVRRGVTFMRELVPRRAIAFVASAVYNEPYRALSMRHRYGASRPDGIPDRVEYGWRSDGEWSSLGAAPVGRGRSVAPATQEAFLTEHYWGYTRQRDGATIEYRVEHPRWRVWTVETAEIRGNLASVSGSALAPSLRERPVSAFLADGSAVTVYAPTRVLSASPAGSSPRTTRPERGSAA